MQVRIQDARRTGRRVPRHPQHTFQLRTRPWQIQPFLIAPVLPGETLKSATLQARVVTDPLENALIGWWNEYYFFYVKMTDLYDRDILKAAMINPNQSLATLDAATSAAYYHTNGTDLAINWTALCMEVVVDNYFRNEDETFATAAGLLDSIPMASIGVANFMDSATNNDDFVNPSTLDTDLADAGSAGGTKVLTSEIEAAMRAWQLARIDKTTDMTWEDWLRSYGVNIPEEDIPGKPELLRYIRDWSYPTVTINPSDGVPSSAVAWSVRDRIDKDRFFKEPGFVFGVTVCRPKVYLANLTSAAVMLMKDAVSWFSPFLQHDAWSRLVKVTASDPPLDANTDDYWIDLGDLLTYGDQFVNFAMSATDDNSVALPAAALGSTGKRYASSTDADSLFKTEATLNKIRQDGIVNLHILGRISDTTPMSVGNDATV